MKRHPLLLLIPILLASSAAMAGKGPTLQCHERFNIGIYNKDLPGGACYSLTAPGKYCIGAEGGGIDEGHTIDTCFDEDDLLYVNDNESVGFKSLGSTQKVDMYLSVGRRDDSNGPNGHYTDKDLHFIYDHGALYSNCSEIFGNDAVCRITESGNSNHLTYLLTISKR